MIAALEKFLSEAEERGTTFFLNLLEKQHVRLKGIYERHVVCTIFTCLWFLLDSY